jgi:hypothetical protein
LRRVPPKTRQKRCAVARPESSAKKRAGRRLRSCSTNASFFPVSSIMAGRIALFRMRGNVDLWSEAGDFQQAGSALHPIVQRADRGTIGFGNCEMQGIGSTDVDILATGDFGGAMEIER